MDNTFEGPNKKTKLSGHFLLISPSCDVLWFNIFCTTCFFLALFSVSICFGSIFFPFFNRFVYVTVKPFHSFHLPLPSFILGALFLGQFPFTGFVSVFFFFLPFTFTLPGYQFSIRCCWLFFPSHGTFPYPERLPQKHALFEPQTVSAAAAAACTKPNIPSHSLPGMRFSNISVDLIL